MSGNYTRTVRTHGKQPSLEVLELTALQASSDGPQEIDLANYDEVAVEFFTECCLAIAADAADAATDFAAGTKHRVIDGSYHVFYKRTDSKTLWLLNSVDSITAEAANISYYTY